MNKTSHFAGFYCLKNMIYDVITIFPEIISDYTKISIVARGIKKKLIQINPFDLRSVTKDAHKTVDDNPYGGGAGMVLKADIMQKAINKLTNKQKKLKTRVILLTPQGKVFNQKEAKRLARFDRLIFVSGRYEGFDERIRSMVNEEFSIGDYVLMGGELPALVMIEAVSRFVPGVVGKSASVEHDSFSEGLLEFPQYTRPEIVKVGKKDMRVPKVLLSGNHRLIEEWRKEESIKRTKKRRPDLLKDA
jgi:tRNA (guanine37-N1)-methyltransferase